MTGDTHMNVRTDTPLAAVVQQDRSSSGGGGGSGIVETTHMNLTLWDLVTSPMDVLWGPMDINYTKGQEEAVGQAAHAGQLVG